MPMGWLDTRIVPDVSYITMLYFDRAKMSVAVAHCDYRLYSNSSLKGFYCSPRLQPKLQSCRSSLRQHVIRRVRLIQQ